MLSLASTARERNSIPALGKPGENVHVEPVHLPTTQAAQVDVPTAPSPIPAKMLPVESCVQLTTKEVPPLIVSAGKPESMRVQSLVDVG